MRQNMEHGKKKNQFLIVVFLVMTLTMPLMFSSAISTNVTETNNINITAKETKQKIAENPSVVLFDENSNNTYSNINESLIINQLERLNRASIDNVNCSDIDRLTMIYAAYAALVNFGRAARFTLAADLLDHFLDNTGTYYTADSKYFKNDRYVKKAQRELYTDAKKKIKEIADTIERCGETKKFNFDRVSNLITPKLSPKLWCAFGSFYLKSTHRGTITKKCGEGYYYVDMETTWKVDDEYNWHIGLRGPFGIPDDWAKELVICGWASEFYMGTSWTEKTQYTIPITPTCTPCTKSEYYEDCGTIEILEEIENMCDCTCRYHYYTYESQCLVVTEK